MKNTWFTSFAILSLLLFFQACAPAFLLPPVRRGEFDASQIDNAVKLEGTWKFFPDYYFSHEAEGILSDAANLGRVRKNIDIKLPGVWNSIQPAWSVGTYQLHISGVQAGKLYAFQFKGILSRADIYQDNEHLGSWGASGLTFVPRIYYLKPDSSEFYLTVAIENSVMSSGGLWLPVYFGTAEKIEQAASTSRFFEILLIGGVFIMGLYHITIFLFRPKERSPLFFGLFCLVTIIKSGWAGEQVFGMQLPFIDEEFGMRTAYIMTILLPIFFLLYLEQLFPAGRSRRLLAFIGFVASAQAVVSLFFPLHLVQTWFLPYQIIIIIASIYVVVMLLAELRRKSPGSLYMLLGFFVIFLSAINDILHDTKVIVTFYSANLGIALFLFSQALIMGGMFARNFKEVQDLNETLELRVAQRTAELELLSRSDHLTGLMNRRFFWDLVNQEWERWKRYGHDFALVMIDLDHFKQLNDKHGHTIGDAALKALADLLLQNVRKTDSVARYGGEEFCIIFPTLGMREASAVMEKIRLALAGANIIPNENPGVLTLSYGISQASLHENPEEVLDAADKLMYRAKRSGRNRGMSEGFS